MPIQKEELQERAQLVRVFEASCAIEHPTPDEQNFRIAVMKQIGVAFRLREVRAMSIAGPVSTSREVDATVTRMKGGK